MSQTPRQAVKWLGTLNNPDLTTCEQFIHSWVSAGASFCTGQLEKGKECGTLHL